MIGPTNSGGEGFARRLNRADWLESNQEPPASEIAGVCFVSVATILMGCLMAVGAVSIGQQAVGICR